MFLMNMPRVNSIVLLLVCFLVIEVLMVSGESFYDSDDEGSQSISIEDNRSSIRKPADKRPSNIYMQRGCIRRGGACDHRPNDCCFSSSCRCNLWGSNCRCQRMGLFQKWG